MPDRSLLGEEWWAGVEENRTASSLTPDPATHIIGWFHLGKHFSSARYIFQGTPGFPFLAPSPPTARLTLESIFNMLFSFHFWLKKHPPSCPAWFLIFTLGLSPRRKDAFSLNCRQELQTPSGWICWAFWMRLESEGSKHYK